MPVLGVQALLPAPRRVADIKSVVAFRASHENELSVVRAALRSSWQDLEQTDLPDALHVMRMKMAEPLSEIERALKLHKSLGICWISRQSLSIVSDKLKGAVESAVAGGIASPLFGMNLDGSALAAGAVGGAALFVVAQVSRFGRNWFGWKQLDRHLRLGPYRYLYSMAKQFDGLVDPPSLR
jgi:hypothetical protein